MNKNVGETDSKTLNKQCILMGVNVHDKENREIEIEFWSTGRNRAFDFETSDEPLHLIKLSGSNNSH